LDVRPIGIPIRPAAWLDPRYLLDFAVKSAVAFHVAWLLAVVGAWHGGRGAVPRPFVGWAVGGLLYMGAGYAHNSLAGIGYPLRLTWVLFPLVLTLAALGGQRLAAQRDARVVALVLVAVNAGLALAGTLLDPGRSGVTVPALIAR
jgi:hypothetical protein